MSFFSQSRRVGCHTAYQHYEMFHGHKACCGDIPSVFNVVYNTPHCRCGSSSWGGGFWGGIGMGFGMGFANLFSGILGNIFGGFGFGFPSFGGGWGDFGLGGHQLSSRNTNNTQGAENKDYEKLNKLFERKNKLLGQEKPSVKDLETLLNDIVALEKNLDGNEDKKDKDYIKQLKFGLQDKINELKGTPDNDGKAKATPEPDKSPKKVAAKPTVAATPAPATVADNATKINDAKTLDELLKLTPTTDDEKKAFVNKYLELNPKPTADDLAKIDEALRKLIKQKLYGNYTNYDGKTKLNNGDVTLANDTSGKTRNTVNKTGKTTKIVSSLTGNHPETITIYDTKTITYTYQDTIDGEYIYKSNATGGQLYALQKTTDGKYELKQYSWHNGYGTKDWS